MASLGEPSGVGEKLKMLLGVGNSTHVTLNSTQEQYNFNVVSVFSSLIVPFQIYVLGGLSVNIKQSLEQPLRQYLLLG